MADYATVAEVKTSLSDAMPSSETQYDSLLAALVTRASRYVDSITGRQPDAYAASASSARRFNGNNKQQLLIDEAAVITLVESSDDGGGNWATWNSADWHVVPYATPPHWAIGVEPMGARGYFPKGSRNVRVTAIWGYSTAVPALITQCAIIQTVRWFKRGQSAFGDAFANADLGGLQFVKGIDPDIQTMLFDGGFRRVAL